MSRKKEQQALSDKEEAFLEHYLVSWNAADAARKAGYEPTSARKTGYDLLTKPYIIAAKKERLKALQMETDEWFARTTEHARGDLGELLDDDGCIDLPAARAANKTRLLSEYSVEVRTEKDKEGKPVPVIKTKIKLYSAQHALDQIAKRRGQDYGDTQQAILEEQLDLLKLKKEEILSREDLLRLLQKKLSKEVYLLVLAALSREDDTESQDPPLPGKAGSGNPGPAR